MTYKIYSGVKDLHERTPIAYALTAGIKVISLPVEQRPFKRDGTRMAGGVHANDRLFIKRFRSDRPAGTPWEKAVRPLADGYEQFNGVSEAAPPTGSIELVAALPGGELREGKPRAIWNHHRRAYKLGVLRGQKLVRKKAREENPEPNHAAECVGDGTDATRWMPHPETGEWGHQDIACTGDRCPFAPVCKAYSRLWLLAPGTGLRNAGLMQLESNGRDTAAGMKGFFSRISAEAAELGLTSLYMLPVRITIGTKTKGAGVVSFGAHSVRLKNRRFPVIDITEAMSLAEFAQYQRQMLGGAPERLLPEPPATPGDMAASDQDLALVEDTASRPSEEAEIVEGEIVDEGEAIEDEPPAFIGDERAKQFEDYIRKHLPRGTSWKGLDPEVFGPIATLAELPEDMIPHLRERIALAKGKS